MGGPASDEAAMTARIIARLRRILIHWITRSAYRPERRYMRGSRSTG
jgi:hypothetical protein